MNSIFWCGSVLNYDGLRKFRGESPAATQWSQGLLGGFREIGFGVETFSPIWDAYFPKGELFPGQTQFLDSQISQTLIRYVNLPMLREESVAYSLAKSIQNRLAKGNKPTAILTYNTYPHYVKAMEKVTRAFPDIPWFNVVLDLDDPLQDEWSSLKRSTAKSTGCIFLSWWGYVNAPVDNKLHLDGGSDEKLSNYTFESPKTFVYAGKFAGYGGINQIIETIDSLADCDVVFEFYGKDKCPDLNKLASRDSRVQLKGFVSNSALELACQRAYAFLAPRDVHFQGTRMVFPSKILYYLKYGKPIVGPMLPGMSDEYRDIVFSPPDSSADSWHKVMNKVLNLSSSDLADLRNRIHSMLREKSWRKQAKRVVDFIAASQTTEPLRLCRAT